MKKIKKAIYFYTTLILFSVILQSCCTQVYTIIGDGTIESYESDNFTIISVVRKPFQLIWSFEVSVAGLSPNVGLATTALATTCAQENLNLVLDNTIKVSSDKGFIYDGVTYEANSDFSQIEELEIVVNQFRGSHMTVTFPQEFLDKVEFPNELINFKIETDTDDGLSLASEIELEIDL